jgi:hypothetical protein
MLYSACTHARNVGAGALTNWYYQALMSHAEELHRETQAVRPSHIAAAPTRRNTRMGTHGATVIMMMMISHFLRSHPPDSDDLDFAASSAFFPFSCASLEKTSSWRSSFDNFDTTVRVISCFVPVPIDET